MSEITIFAAADIPYFIQHGRAFCNSIHRTGNKGLVVTFPNMNMDATLQMETLASELAVNNAFLESVQVQFVDIPEYLSIYNSLNVVEDRAFYASMRFLLLPQIYKQSPLLTVDIDSLIQEQLKPIPSEYEFGLFLREDNQIGGNEYEKQGMKVAAGIVYTTPAATDFVEGVYRYLTQNKLQWFVDQHALYQTYLQLKDRNIFYFNQSTLDWEFKKGTAIWTGKGARKYEDVTYVAAKRELEK
jgi:hypothetical protein